VKVQTTKSYQEYLIASLKDPEEAAGYITAILEEEAPEPGLLYSALKDIGTALAESKDLGLQQGFRGERSQSIYLTFPVKYEIEQEANLGKGELN